MYIIAKSRVIIHALRDLHFQLQVCFLQKDPQCLAFPNSKGKEDSCGDSLEERVVEESL